MHVANGSVSDAIVGLGVRRLYHDVATHKQRLVQPLENGLFFRQGRVGPVVAGSDVAQLVLREKLVLQHLIVLHLNVHGDGLATVLFSIEHRMVVWGNRLHKLI